MCGGLRPAQDEGKIALYDWGWRRERQRQRKRIRGKEKEYTKVVRIWVKIHLQCVLSKCVGLKA